MNRNKKVLAAILAAGMALSAFPAFPVSADTESPFTNPLVDADEDGDIDFAAIPTEFLADAEKEKVWTISLYKYRNGELTECDKATQASARNKRLVSENYDPLATYIICGDGEIVYDVDNSKAHPIGYIWELETAGAYTSYRFMVGKTVTLPQNAEPNINTNRKVNEKLNGFKNMTGWLIAPNGDKVAYLMPDNTESLKKDKEAAGIHYFYETADPKSAYPISNYYNSVHEEYSRTLTGFAAPFKWHAESKERFYSGLRDYTVTKTADGSFIVEYGDGVYESSYTFKALKAKQKPVKDDNGNITVPSGYFLTLPLLDNTDADGKGLGNEDIFESITVFKDGKPDSVIPSKDCNSLNQIAAWDDDGENILARVNVDPDAGKFIWYKLDPETGLWDFRVNTEDTPNLALQVSPQNFPDEAAPYTIKDDSGKVIGNGKIEDFYKEDTANLIPINNDNTPVITFNYGDDGTSEYAVNGIDVIPTARGKNAYPDLMNVPVTAPVGTPIHVTGKTEDGIPVDFTAIVQGDDNGNYIPLSDGAYTLTDTATGITADITVDADGSLGKTADENGNDIFDGKEDKPVNLTEKQNVNSFKVINPKTGEVVDSGKLNDGVLDNLRDLNKSKNQLDEISPYFLYETEVGTVNVTPDTAGAVVREKGVMVVNGDKTITKYDYLLGDVDCNGKLNVADAVMLQKWLLTGEGMEMKNFINGDLDGNGRLDARDLTLEKRLLMSSAVSAKA